MAKTYRPDDDLFGVSDITRLNPETVVKAIQSGSARALEFVGRIEHSERRAPRILNGLLYCVSCRRYFAPDGFSPDNRNAGRMNRHSHCKACRASAKRVKQNAIKKKGR